MQTNPNPSPVAIKADTLSALYKRVRLHMREANSAMQRRQRYPRSLIPFVAPPLDMFVDYVVDGLPGVRRGRVLRVRWTMKQTQHMGAQASYERPSQLLAEGPWGTMVCSCEGPDSAFNGTGTARDHNGRTHHVQLLEAVAASEREGADIASVQHLPERTTTQGMSDEQLGVLMRYKFNATQIDNILGL